MSLAPNAGKSIEIQTSEGTYERFPVKTHVVSAGDNIVEVVQKYAVPHMQAGDILFISERVVAISQGRAYAIKDIVPSRLAKFLVRFVHKSPYGIGLGSPWTMELAIREAGALRMLIAAVAAAITKPFGLRGVFYHVVGNNINAIDGPCDYTIPLTSGDRYAKLGPKNPNKVAREIAKAIGHEVVIIDANDLGANILGKSEHAPSDALSKAIFRDNPLGQSGEQTPLCIVRKI
jgi:F420-0:gamma-glutamyl ligase-like protein